MDPELTCELYGFRGQKWIRVIRDRAFLPDVYSGRVPDEFEFKHVDYCEYEWYDSNYCDNLQGFNITWSLPEGSSHRVKATKRTKELPHGDPELYKVVDILLDIDVGLDVEIKGQYDSLAGEHHEITMNYEYDCQDVLHLAKTIKNRAEENYRKVQLLQGTNIFDLVNKLDQATESAKDIKSQLEDEQDKSKALQDELDQKKREISQLRAQFDRLHTENAQLKGEREGYQKAIVEKIRETISKM